MEQTYVHAALKDRGDKDPWSLKSKVEELFDNCPVLELALLFLIMSPCPPFQPSAPFTFELERVPGPCNPTSSDLNK